MFRRLGNPVALSLVFISCCINVVLLELLIKEDPGCGNIITFAQFLFIALEGFITTTRFLQKEPIIPISNYIKLVVLFFVVSVVNNYALNFNISMPLHMIFKSGSLLANMILGIIILKKRYNFTKYVSVAMITVGILICTVASSKDVSKNTATDNNYWSILHWLFGLVLLTFALFMAARMGLYQEVLYLKYGKHPREALFYLHALPLPGFILLAKDLYYHATIFSQSDLIFIPLFGSIPKMWLYLLGSVITQYICISSVFVLTTEYSSLTVTLVVTLRKFISLLLSIFYFKNTFTQAHWVGTALVFLGTLLFAEVLRIRKRKKQN